MSRYEGGCFCGDIRYQVEGPEMYACYCHCESCRRAAGGTHVPWATFRKDAFTITSGAMTEHHSAAGVTRGHCARCGTSLTYEHKNREGQVDITLTSLDDASAITPRSHIWLEDKLPWVVIDDDLPQYDKNAG